MDTGLTHELQLARTRFRTFAEGHVAPSAAAFDQDEFVSWDLMRRMGTEGYFGAVLPAEWGGVAMDALAYGLLHEEIGRACSSVRSLLTVHNMAAHAILRWGTNAQRARWLPRLATGETRIAFALTEPAVGSDARTIATTARPTQDGYALHGRKLWITGAQIADVFLVVARCDDQPTAFLVERDRPGVRIEPISRLLGVRGSLVAHVELDDARVDRDTIVGRIGVGFSHVACSALDLGRYAVAWGCVGIARAALEASLSYTAERQQFGKPLRDHQLIQAKVTNMMVDTDAARLMCHQAGCLRQRRDPRANVKTAMAKYFAARAAMRAATAAVQIHGANGCSDAYPVARYFRDAKIMEIIEGTNEIQQLTIAPYGYSQCLAD